MTIVRGGRRFLTDDEFLDHFSNVRQVGPDRYRAECKAHASTSKQSVSIWLPPELRLIHDFGGCATEDTLAAAGLTLSDLYRDGATKSNDHRQTNAHNGASPHGRKDVETAPRDVSHCPECGAVYFFIFDGERRVVLCANGHGAPASMEGEIRSWMERRNAERQREQLLAKLRPADTGETLLSAVYEFLGRFVAYPSEHAHVAHALWVMHTHLMDAWESTPRAAFLSPEPASGKTRALEITELLVPRPVEAVNVTPAYLFRKVADEAGRPTILYDEIDTVFGPKAKDNEEIRGLLNAGHRVGAVAGRCVVRGKLVVTEEIPAYCAVALAGLGGLPDTILSRSVIVRMRRRAPGERVEPFRRRLHAGEGYALRDRIAAWAETVEAQAAEMEPAMPDGIEDRDADLWEPLLVVADLAGGEWPARARRAAVTLVTDSKESTPSLGIRLLADIHEVFGDADVLSTEQILSGLHKLDEAPWAEVIGGKPLNARGLAQRLHQYGIKSQTVRLATTTTAKGYRRADFADAWARYLGSPPQESDTSVTTDTLDTIDKDTAEQPSIAPTDATHCPACGTARGPHSECYECHTRPCTECGGDTGSAFWAVCRPCRVEEVIHEGDTAAP
jgi:hypothetical protein